MRRPAAPIDRKSLILRCWRSASGYWQGPTAPLAWLLLVLSVLAVILQLIVQYRLNFWSRDLFNAIEQKNADALVAQAVAFVPLAVMSVAIALTAVWSRMTIDREWRRWFSQHLFDYWMDDDAHARLKFVPGEHQTPEYRIADDARVATDLPIDLVLGFFSSVLTASTFIGVLWSVGGNLEIKAFGVDIAIGGYLVVAVAIYSVLLTSAMLIVGRRLAQVSDANKASEAELRAAGANLRAAGEGNQSPQAPMENRRAIGDALVRVTANWRDLCFQVIRMTFVSHINMLIAPSVSLLLCAPKYLTGDMTLGTVVQAAAAFVAVQAAFNWVADNYGRLVEWATSASRVGSLLCSLDQVNGISPANERGFGQVLTIGSEVSVRASQSTPA
jgi:vitamin B12/bleomycin/antimicrobial peptide transport system ATP-binding/permease protein